MTRCATDDAPAAQLEAVAVALERGVVPAVLAVAEGPGVLDGDRRGELPQVEPVVRVVVEARAGDPVAGAGAELDGDAVGVLAVARRRRSCRDCPGSARGCRWCRRRAG